MKTVDRIHLGKNVKIEPGARVGLRSPRMKERGTTTIGPGSVIRRGTMVYAGTMIGKSLETGHHAVIREDNIIGDNFKIWNNSTIDYGCRIGRNVKVHCNCYVAQFTRLEDDVFLAPGVTIANDLYPGLEISTQKMRGPHLDRGVQVGVNATILPYVHIGEGSVIGAGSVVTRSVPPRSLVYGNPARVHGKVKHQEWKRKVLTAIS